MIPAPSHTASTGWGWARRAPKRAYRNDLRNPQPSFYQPFWRMVAAPQETRVAPEVAARYITDELGA
ncbi:protein of unknown function [Hyphomicrobium sp. MC1]|nr:protein of unknown function [Hyphomicrobium sp. MC1]